MTTRLPWAPFAKILAVHASSAPRSTTNTGIDANTSAVQDGTNAARRGSSACAGYRMLTAELKLPNGAMRGVPRDQQGVLTFKGIPYAAPPVGELRWRPPQDAVSWTGVREAQTIGNPCVGAPVPMAGV